LKAQWFKVERSRKFCLWEKADFVSIEKGR
jgi:hypothetical protein